MKSGPELDLTVVLACRDDEDVVGHTIRRVTNHVRALGLRAELLVVDEGSADNTLSLLALLRGEIPELEIVLGADEGRGFVRGLEQARGRAVLVLDARSEAPLSALGFALQRISDRRDAVVVSARYLVLHRTRTLRAHGALIHARNPSVVEQRFLRRVHALGLRVDVAASRRRPNLLERLRETLFHPVATRI